LNPLFLKKIDGSIGSALTRLLPRPARAVSATSTVSRLLLIRPGGIGDAVLLVPAIQALRKVCPDAAIHVLAESRNAAVFGLCPDADAVFCYDRPKELLSVLGGKYDVVIDTEQWHRLSAVVARLIRSQVKIGFGTNERQRLFTHAISYEQGFYEKESFSRLLEPLGCTGRVADSVPFLSVPEVARQKASELLDGLVEAPFVVFFPGASIPERRWGAERFRDVAAWCRERGLPVVVVGGREDTGAGDAIVAAGWGINLSAKTSLAQTAAVIEQSTLLVSGDSGVLHLGVGLGKPTVSLFGSGIAAKWAPRGERHVVLNKNLPCSPCTKFGYTPPCPINATCLSEISVADVTAAIETLLARLELS
jgi:ADP-heptose:LPS heptosyltransferase